MKRSLKLALIWCTVAVTLGVVWGAPILLEESASKGSDWLRFLGRFHIALLHFPIVCLLLVAGAWVGSLFRGSRAWAAALTPLLLLAASSAVVASLTGAFLAAGEGLGGALMERHQLLGIWVASFATVAAAFRLSGYGTKQPWSTWGAVTSLAAACALVVLAAHDGGSMVHGKGYLEAYAPRWAKSWLASIRGEEGDTKAVSTGSGMSLAMVDRFEDTIQPTLRRYCYRCHGDEEAEAGIRFDQIGPKGDFARNTENWKHVRHALQTMEMPPEDARELPQGERDRLLAWVDDALEETALAKRFEVGSFPMRRLSRREFEHTFQDLFGVSASFATQLPPDPVSEKGYDTTADLLMISNVDLQLYLDTARAALEQYVYFGDRKGGKERFFVELEDLYHYCRMVAYQRTKRLAPRPLTDEEYHARLAAREGKAPVFRDRKYGPLPFGHIPTGDVPGVGEGRGFARLHEQFVLIRTEQTVGEVVVRIHAAATEGADGSYPIMRLETGRSFDSILKTFVAGERDVLAERSEPGVYEFRFRLEDALPVLADSGEGAPEPYLLFVVSNVARHEKGTLAASEVGQGDLFSAEEPDTHSVIVSQTKDAIESEKAGLTAWEKGKVNYLYLDAIEVEILPLSADPSTPWSIALGENSDEESRIARETLERFIESAFRRPTDAEEVERFAALYERFRAGGEGFERALKDAMTAVLVAKPFLYIGRPKELESGDAPEEDRQRSIDLAAKLSYFIWSSMPDERLRSLGAAGQLTNPRVLAEEVRRLVESPKTERFTEAFARQWLGLEGINDVAVSEELYPDYGFELSQLMLRQSIGTFQDVFANDRDARDLFRSDVMLLNAQLARHYGLAPVVGGELRRVKVSSNARNQGGLMGQASMLTINSDGRDSHPIKRGVWMLEKILHDPPPPPPPVVPEIDESDPVFAAMSLKQKIEHHREVHACAGCHGKIDPWGIAFEEFDAIGRWRDPERIERAIDATTLLPDGSGIDGLGELSRYLLEEKEEQMMLGLVKHLMIYALGRDLDVLDEREAASILKSFKISGYSLKHLILAIAQSDAFAQSNKTKKRHG